MECPKCGKKVAGGKFCPNCGASRVSESPKTISIALPSTRILVMAALAIAIVAGGFLVLTGFFQAPTNLSTTLRFPPSACGEEFTYSVELKDANSGMANQPVYAYVDGSLFEKLDTDQNGRVSSTKQVPTEWCGRSINFSVSYNGDLLHKYASSSSILTVFIPTKLQANIPQEITAKEEADATVILRNAVDDSPLANKTVTISDGIYGSMRTDARGGAAFKLLFNETGKKNIKIKFAGDDSYSASESQLVEVNIIPQMCEDGTIVEECSAKSVGYYCNESKMLVFDCSLCGCSQGLVCYHDACVTQEEQIASLVAELQDSIVYVEHPYPGGYVSGSGVIISQEGGKTVILTNHHVIEDADRVSDVIINTSDKKTAHADAIKVAPYGMDLAVIYVTGTYGKVAEINYSKDYERGQGVLALGSPLGLQGSVSNGIISNFVDFDTGLPYQYRAIQTDAAVNHGNSGGGLFLKSTGTLIGINTFKLGEGTEGLNFAIELKELQRLPDYSSWNNFIPIPKCTDGTPYGQCSISGDEYYCNNGRLVPSCGICGCNGVTYPYCATTGPSAGQCFGCLYGSTPYDDGTCCLPGYYRVGYLLCCPTGTYYSGGYCYG